MGDTGRAALTWSHASPGFGVGARGGSAETRHSGRVPACPALRGSLHSLCPCGAGGARGLSTRVLPGTLPEVHSCPCSGGAGREWLVLLRPPSSAVTVRDCMGWRRGARGLTWGRSAAGRLTGSATQTLSPSVRICSASARVCAVSGPPPFPAITPSAPVSAVKVGVSFWLQPRLSWNFAPEQGSRERPHTSRSSLTVRFPVQVCLLGTARTYPPAAEAAVDEQITRYINSRRGCPALAPAQGPPPAPPRAAAGGVDPGGRPDGRSALDAGAEGCWLPGFHPREKAERVRNCASLPREFVDQVVLQVANLLLGGEQPSPGGPRRGSADAWRGGGNRPHRPGHLVAAVCLSARSDAGVGSGGGRSQGDAR